MKDNANTPSRGGLAVGIDLVSVPRFARAMERWGERFSERLFNEAELGGTPRNLAGRFAAKEAFLKALGTGLSSGMRLRDVSVLSSDGRVPVISVSGRAAEALGDAETRVSISHDGDYAVAVCVLF